MKEFLNTGSRPRHQYNDRIPLYYEYNSMNLPLRRSWSKIGTFTDKTLLWYP